MADATGALGLAGKFMGWAAGLLERHRSRARAALSLGWEGLPIMILGEPNPTWRSVELTVISAKHEELVIDTGTIEARGPKGRGWKEVAQLGEFVQLPKTVPANRKESYSISGRSLFTHLAASCRDGAGELDIRIVLRDHYGRATRSRLFRVPLAELQRESTR